MIKNVLIIANPGENGAENYCEGVLKDIENYCEYFKSAIGGAWLASEIKTLLKPTKDELQQSLYSIRNNDYSVVVFSGHGYYSSELFTTVLELKKDEYFSSEALRNTLTKGIVILDCCRKVHPKTAISFTESLKKSARLSRINLEECRRYYEKEISECQDTKVILNSCSIGQVARDDSQLGGLYSFNLLRSAQNWADNDTTDTSKRYGIFSIAMAHEEAKSKVMQLTNSLQVPVIEKPREGKYFPFAINA